jgi:hypothetical protein
MDKFVEIEFQNKTTLVKLSEITMLELAEEEEGYALTIYIAGEESVTVGAEPGNEKTVQALYNDLKARLEAL